MGEVTILSSMNTQDILFACVAALSVAPPASAQFKQLPMEPLHEKGQSVTGSYEGWWQNADGTYNLMFGYLNRNTKEALDIPVGPGNHFDPGPADRGQPTHFVTRRQWGVFTVTVPKDFGEANKLTWTIVANGQTLSVPGHLGASWNITPMHEIGIGNSPPTISFDEKGAYIQGPKPLVAERSAKAGEPLSLTVYAADEDKAALRAARGGRGGGRGGRGAAAADAPSNTTPDPAPTADADPDATPTSGARAVVTLTWQKFRGPGEVKFSRAQVRADAVPGSEVPVKQVFNGKGTITATFSEPGDYILRVIATNSSGAGGSGFLCCWTNGEVKVTVH